MIYDFRMLLYFYFFFWLGVLLFVRAFNALLPLMWLFSPVSTATKITFDIRFAQIAQIAFWPGYWSGLVAKAYFDQMRRTSTSKSAASTVTAHAWPPREHLGSGQLKLQLSKESCFRKVIANRSFALIV